MSPVRGNAVTIIQQALSLGIMARPVGSDRVGVGEGLEVNHGSFRLYCAAAPNREFYVEPWEFLLDWELTTRDLLVKEYQKAMEAPW